jgi:transcriptional regulator with XRE-family HTH domain
VTTLGPVRLQRVPGESLGELLRKYADRVRRQKGKTQAQIARDAWLDESYVSRLLSGERDNPSRDALILLGSWGLELAVEEVDELLMAVDYKPLVLPASLR